MLSIAAENASLKKDLAASILREESIREEKEQTKKAEIGIPVQPNEVKFTVSDIKGFKIKNLFKYYTGFKYTWFLALFNYFVPNPSQNPLTYEGNVKACMALSLEDQLLLVMCRLRNGFHVKDLAFRFNVSAQIVSVIFNIWIRYMYYRLGYLLSVASQGHNYSKYDNPIQKRFSKYPCIH